LIQKILLWTSQDSIVLIHNTKSHVTMKIFF
jgi:hypothetical protein